MVSKRAHDRVLGRRPHSAVQERNPQLTQLASSQSLELLGGGLCFQNLGLLDQRTDDEALLARCSRATDPLVSHVALVSAEQTCPRKLATRRHLVNRRQVEVAVQAQCERAR